MTKKRKYTEAEFAHLIIKKLRKPYVNKKGETVEPKGIHTVYAKVDGKGDNFNQMWEYYFNSSPIEGVNRLVKAGKIDMHPTKGGVMIYLPGEMPVGSASGNPQASLEKLGIL